MPLLGTPFGPVFSAPTCENPSGPAGDATALPPSALPGMRALHLVLDIWTVSSSSLRRNALRVRDAGVPTVRLLSNWRPIHRYMYRSDLVAEPVFRLVIPMRVIRDGSTMFPERPVHRASRRAIGRSPEEA